MKQITVGTTITLLPKTAYGREVINRFGGKWLVVGMESQPFSPGDTNNIALILIESDSHDLRWINLYSDINFEILNFN